MEGLKSYTIDGLQPIPRDSFNKGMAVMLVEQTKEVLEEYFVYVYQYGGDNKTWKPSIFCLLFIFCKSIEIDP